MAKHHIVRFYQSDDEDITPDSQAFQQGAAYAQAVQQEQESNDPNDIFTAAMYSSNAREFAAGYTASQGGQPA
jgi:hypothetical protein